MKNPNSLDDNLIFLAGKLVKRIHDLLTEEFKNEGFGITVEQFGVLSLLWYKDGINQQTIADQLERDKTTIVRIIDNMLKNNLIVKIDDKEDLRNKLIYLTHKGKELQKATIESAGKIYMKALGNLNDGDVDRSVNLLNKVLKNLG